MCTYLQSDHAESSPVARDFDEGTRFANWDQPLAGTSAEDDDDVLLGELLLYYFEWFCVNKENDNSARGVHGLLSMLLPKTAHLLPKWSTLKALLEKCHKENVQAVHLCPNDHIAFIDCTHPKLAHYQHADRTVCPHPGCGAHRFW